MNKYFLSITSFYGSHIINCAGNGGALAINDDKVMEKAKLLRSWGRSSSLFDEKSEAIENRFNVKLDHIDYDAKFVFETVGYNLEGNELGASFGLAQLEKLGDNITTRQENFAKQCTFFERHSKYFSNPVEMFESNTAWLAFPILIKSDAPFTRKEFPWNDCSIRRQSVCLIVPGYSWMRTTGDDTSEEKSSCVQVQRQTGKDDREGLPGL